MNNVAAYVLCIAIVIIIGLLLYLRWDDRD